MVDLSQHTQFNLFNFLIVLENIKAIHISGIKEKATLLSQKDADLLLKYSKDRIWGRKKNHISENFKGSLEYYQKYDPGP